jgi:lysophospholipid acyltransferase (LPLAT)-like uncharacterized protein
MKRLWRRVLYFYLIPYVGIFFVRILSRTYRLTLIDVSNESTLLEKGGLIYASWHQRFFPGITFFARRRPIAIMISPSKDGEVMARIVNILGWKAVRGSSTHGGSGALAELKSLARQGYRIGHIVDGPKGPFGKVKPGLISMAMVTGLPIVPTITSSEKRWTFSSWDRFMVPKPFSRVVIRFGGPIPVPSDLDGDAFERVRLLVEQRMRQLYEETDRLWPER